MSDPNGGHVEELSGAAALRALTPDEARFVRAHLADCARCRAAFAELAEVADLLLRAPEPVEPSEGALERLLAAARETRQEPAGSGVGATETAPAPTGTAVAPTGPAVARVPPEPVRLRPRRLDLRDLGMVASLVLALGLGLWTWRLQEDLTAHAARLDQQRALVEAATRGRVVQIAGTERAPGVRGALAESPAGTVVYLDELPSPPPDRAYQVWLIPPGGQPVGAGLSESGRGGTQAIPLARSAAGMQQVAVTLEPAGGSPGPTTPILAAARL